MRSTHVIADAGISRLYVSLIVVGMGCFAVSWRRGIGRARSDIGPIMSCVGGIICLRSQLAENARHAGSIIQSTSIGINKKGLHRCKP